MSMTKRGWGTVFFGLGLLLIIYAVTRFSNLLGLPIFTDEAIYIRWSQIGGADANWRFISLTDGKQPLFTWVVMALLRFVPGDPLFVGRLASVITGAVSLVGMWFLAWELFKNKRVAWIASFLYLISPFALMYDRMALYDSMVATFFIWNFYLAIRLARDVRLDIALIFGLTLGLGMLNKTSGFLSLFLLPATILLMDLGKKNILKRLGSWLILATVAAVLSQVLYSVLRLSPFFHMISQKDSVFVYPLSDWIRHPFQFLEGNLSGQFDWLRSYMTLPIFVASLAPLFVFWKNMREKLVAYIYWLAPFVALAMFGRILYPRFIFFMTMPLFVLASISIDWLWTRLNPKIWKISLVFILFIQYLYMDYFIITNPMYAPIPYSDKGQYVDSWPAGWGVPEVNAFLKDASTKGNVAVFTEGTFGLLPAAIEMYFINNKNIYIEGIWPLPDQIPEKITSMARRMPTYFVMNQTQETPLGWPLELVAQYQKGTRRDRNLRFFRVFTQESL